MQVEEYHQRETMRFLGTDEIGKEIIGASKLETDADLLRTAEEDEDSSIFKKEQHCDDKDNLKITDSGFSRREKGNSAYVKSEFPSEDKHEIGSGTSSIFPVKQEDSNCSPLKPKFESCDAVKAEMDPDFSSYSCDKSKRDPGIDYFGSLAEPAFAKEKVIIESEKKFEQDGDCHLKIEKKEVKTEEISGGFHSTDTYPCFDIATKDISMT